MKRKKRVVKSVRHIKKKFFYKLLAVLLIVLFFILLAYLIFFVLEKISKPEKEKPELEGGLKTLCIFCEENKVVLEVLNYSIVDYNQTINITINWSSGEGEVNDILFIFNRVEGECNYTSYDLPTYGINKNYEIKSNDSYCGENNFSDITSIEAFAEVYIHLTQIQKIENISLYKNENTINFINLSSYFICLENIGFSLVEDPENDNIRTEINNQSLVSFYLVTDWFGTQKFNLTANCGEETLNVSSNGENMTFYVVILNETRLSVNHLPDFLSVCEDLEWEMNKSYILDMEICWGDDDNDVLVFRYDNVGNSNLTISQSGTNLTLTPNTNWNGTGYFHIYANDSKNETQGRVDFRVFKTGTNVTTNQTNITVNNTPVIKSPSPSSEEINISSNKSQEFSIIAENYDSIKWYVDDVLVKSNVSSYSAGNLSKGEHEIKVEVKKGSNIVSKTWSLFVVGEKETPKKNFFIYLIVVFVILGILILMVIFLIIKNVIEKKEENVPRPVIKELKPEIRIKYIPPSRP